MWLPILGWIAAFILSELRYGRHRRDVLDPMGEEIREQLAARKGESLWGKSARTQKIIQIISDAVGREKFMDPPPLHPRDSFGMLFWGPFDDLTPLTFRLSMHQEFGLGFTAEEFCRFWYEDWALEELVDYCDHRISQVSPPG